MLPARPLSTHRSTVLARALVAVRLLSFAVLALAFAAPAVTAQTIVYVDNRSASCSPTGPGTELAPFCTITDAMKLWKGAGVTIVVKPGVYREQVTINATAAGTAAAPFVLRAQGPGVVIEGSDDFASTTQWLPSLGTAFVAASVVWTPKQVYVDGVRLGLTTLTPDLMPVHSFRWVAGEGLYVNLGGANPGARLTLVGRRSFGFNMLSTAFVRVEGFAITHTEDRGIQMQNPCADLEIVRNTVSFANSYGIQTVNGQRIRIEGNVVSDCNLHGIGLTAGASGCEVVGNESFRNAHPTIRQANGIFLSAAPGNRVERNRVHDNQDTGVQFNAGSNGCVSVNNISYRNGDHGYDHLGTSNVVHVNEVAYGNFMDGFSFEGNSPGGQLYNCIATENGLTTNEYNLWVDATSSVGFLSDHNLFWNSTPQPPIKFIASVYPTLGAYQLASGLDANSRQADPRYTAAVSGDFRVLAGSPAIDRAHSGVANWPVNDCSGAARLDDPRTLNRGEGPVAYGDLGVFEFVPVDAPPVVISPGTVTVARGGTVSFQVTASDPDGDAIVALTMFAVKMPTRNSATFRPNAGKTGGTFTWNVGTNTGTYKVGFIARNAQADTSITTIQVRSRTRAGVPADDEGLEPLPPVVALSSAYPNPSATSVAFSLDLPEATQVEMAVYDMQGRHVWSQTASFAAGRSVLRWEGRNSAHQRVGSGVYLVRVRAGEQSMVRRVIRM
ncbi:MAG: right-handed parallel beta-helix repeat-containing protein [Candidatus Eisenbacteria bacterium]